MKIIFIQGPPRSGKDSFAAILAHELGRKYNLTTSKTYKFAEPIRSVVQAVLGSDFNIEANKDRSMKDFITYMGDPHTVRDFMIAFSEDFLKLRYGPNIFGEILNTKLVLDNVFGVRYAIISDSGFPDEALPLINQFGAHNCAIIKLAREDCNFDNDSRNYWSAEGVTEHKFFNAEAPSSWVSRMGSFAKYIIGVLDEEDS